MFLPPGPLPAAWLSLYEYVLPFDLSDQTKLIDLEEMAKTMSKGKWSADASNVSAYSTVKFNFGQTIMCSCI